MPDKLEPNVHTTAFNNAAPPAPPEPKPFPSEKGISTKAEAKKRTENAEMLKKNLDNAGPQYNYNREGEIPNIVNQEKFQAATKAYEQNQEMIERIERRLREKKPQQEFSRAADPKRVG